MSEEFSGYTLEAISLNSEFDVFLGDNQAETIMLQLVTRRQEQDVLVRRPGFRGIKDPGKLAGVEQAVLACEGVFAHGFPGGLSSRQALAAPGPTTVDDLAACLGGHP